MIDFTLNTHQQLLHALRSGGYSFYTFREYATGAITSDKWVVLRQDVDARPGKALKMAQLQADHGVRASYYFRKVKQSYHEGIMRQIAEMGHEVGYHYETMDTQNGNPEKAYAEFCATLEEFRRVVDVATVSMHGSPLSSFDNRELWYHYDYRGLGIVGEPYFDLDFNRVYYITDTGRRWDGHRFNVRDKATKVNPVTNPDFLLRRYHSTSDIIRAVHAGDFPGQAMFNMHPQRWNNECWPWFRELVQQNVKNGAKFLLVYRQQLK
jgi:hypothetical protein